MTRPVKCIFCLAAGTGRSRPPLILYRFRLRENASGCRYYERHGRKRELFDDKGSDIGIGCRHGHSAEDTVAFAPCDDPDVVAGILFSLEPLYLVMAALAASALMEVDWFQYQVPLGFVGPGKKSLISVCTFGLIPADPAAGVLGIVPLDKVAVAGFLQGLVGSNPDCL